MSIVFVYKRLNTQTVLFGTVQYSISTVSMLKIIIFQTIQFSICIQFSPILLIDRTLPGNTTPYQSGPGSDGNEGVLRIPQSSCITVAPPSDCLVSYPWHSLRESYHSEEKQSVYSTALADWAIDIFWVSQAKIICSTFFFCRLIAFRMFVTSLWCSLLLPLCFIVS